MRDAKWINQILGGLTHLLTQPFNDANRAEHFRALTSLTEYIIDQTKDNKVSHSAKNDAADNFIKNIKLLENPLMSQSPLHVGLERYIKAFSAFADKVNQFKGNSRWKDLVEGMQPLISQLKDKQAQSQQAFSIMQDQVKSDMMKQKNELLSLVPMIKELINKIESNVEEYAQANAITQQISMKENLIPKVKGVTSGSAPRAPVFMVSQKSPEIDIIREEMKELEKQRALLFRDLSAPNRPLINEHENLSAAVANLIATARTYDTLMTMVTDSHARDSSPELGKQAYNTAVATFIKADDFYHAFQSQKKYSAQNKATDKANNQANPLKDQPKENKPAILQTPLSAKIDLGPSAVEFVQGLRTRLDAINQKFRPSPTKS